MFYLLSEIYMYTYKYNDCDSKNELKQVFQNFSALFELNSIYNSYNLTYNYTNVIIFDKKRTQNLFRLLKFTAIIAHRIHTPTTF